VYDPIAMDACRQQHPDLKIQFSRSVSELTDGLDALVVVTEWDEFRRLDLAALAARMSRPILIDGRNMFDPDVAVRAGFDYSAIGRGRRLRPGSVVTQALRAAS
jgi:UDPglucose 6-dehydrogenase